MKNKWLILGGFAFLLALPLLNLPPWFAPPEWSKALVFRAIAFLGLAGIGWALLAPKPLFSGLKEALRPHRGLLLLLGSYVSVLLASTLLSQNPQMGLLGIPLRGGGALDLALLFFFAVALFTFLRERDWLTLWKVALGTGVLVALVALFQQFGSPSELFVTGVSRPGSTIGGPAFLASYLLLLMFPAIAFGLQAKHSAAKMLYFGAVIVFIAVITLGLTRGAYLGLFAGLAWFVGWYPSPRRYRKLLQMLVLAVAIIGILSITYLNLAQLPKSLQDNQFFVGMHSRLQIESLLEARYGTWVISWEAVKDRPLLGYGIENALVGLNKNFDPSLPGISNPSEGWWLDRGHNIILDTLLAGGIAALALFALFLFFLFQKLQRSKKTGTSRAVFFHAVQALLITYVVANLTSFDSFSVQLLFFFAIAWSFSLLQSSSVENLTRLNLPQGARILGAAAIPLAFVLVWQISLNPLLTNAKVNEATHLSNDTKTCEESIALFDSLNQREHIQVTKIHVKTQYANAINRCISQDMRLSSLRTKQYQLLYEILQERPEHAEVWIRFGGLATTFAEQSFSQGKTQEADLLF
ncbi:MAG: O-antigen ligase family protein, partial [bacterium]|nr:O-antigen ligase family protein [bacterium]